MIVKSNNHSVLHNGETQLHFLSTGDVHTFSYKHLMINQLAGNSMDGSLNNLYLRVLDGDSIHFYPLVGQQSQSTFFSSESKLKWRGNVHGIEYEITFHLASEHIWFWEVNVEGQKAEIDLIYGQDIGLADKNALRANEAYVAQYVDHAVFKDDQQGYVVCSRQNQPQGTGYPYLQQGSLGRNVGYSTDGFQFFGLNYKETNIPEALGEETLANETYQYEFAFTALQSEKISLNGKASFVFYGCINEDHAEAVKKPLFTEEIKQAWEKTTQVHEAFDLVEAEKFESFSTAQILTSAPAAAEEIQVMYPDRLLEEWDGDTLLSFFTPTYEHVVLREKELQLERSHGHILMSGENHQLSGQPTITSTSYMPGVFNAQVVIGNTSMNKLLSNVRNPLNIFKTSGQRIYVKTTDTYQLLTMPAVYEIGFNYARWMYKLPDDELTITSYSVVNEKSITLHVSSAKHQSYDFIITNQITMNNHEYEAPFHMEVNGDSFTVKGDASSDNANVHPDLAYRFTLKGAELNVVDHNQDSIVSIAVNQSSDWTLTMEGSLTGHFPEHKALDFSSERARYRSYFKKVMNGFSLSHSEPSSVEKVNAIAWWYTHNMLVHYSVPHGLEQYGGAAWGTRDVCQGPTEYFLATQQYDSVKEIIKTVYSHQYEDKGDWPQWFMFDEYKHIQHDHSHGDVIVWPLKVVADYLTTTGDYSVLDMPVPYTKRSDFQFTETSAPLMDHLTKQLETIKENFLHDTHLSSYGDGDWDDTLQPANQQLRQYMVSSWTVSLTYQTIRTLSKSLQNVRQDKADRLAVLSDGIEKDFKAYMLNTGVLPGFLYFEDKEHPENMVHPLDQKTGIHYRLLPMTRSMISELLTPEEAAHHEAIIHDQFYCPDGVRLMNRPANYDGGVTKHFKRAEQASNFGREIGLQYVHAHIRFVEAMAKIGRTEEVWKGLETINPIGITSVVPNAEKRQSNAYFSSSDGKFATRYAAQERFEELRNGDVPVKGGWRIYSSGPGIYMNQLISNALGLRHEGDFLLIDPVLPSSLDGLEFTYHLFDRPVTIRYHLSKEKSAITVNGSQLKYEAPSNRYRQNGYKVNKQDVMNVLTPGSNLIEIWS
ncbi:cellobiose phosphorylase [Jeotgalibacillus sp. ET6]|uniref:GH36-type glycosyl hydrolase domain-containing protein n=1 Tax=Jeotgalibacillus sp. ET6 TaxID=3037260 RepID=UPI002418A1B6|nr:cellobiose phosphorylase [Jeotgalibacillus sp. ET6]MDG5472675.1 cellobiose phosphorylase [Jeotgalibacillus sp. ET6]